MEAEFPCQGGGKWERIPRELALRELAALPGDRLCRRRKRSRARRIIEGGRISDALGLNPPPRRSNRFSRTTCRSVQAIRTHWGGTKPALGSEDRAARGKGTLPAHPRAMLPPFAPHPEQTAPGFRRNPEGRSLHSGVLSRGRTSPSTPPNASGNPAACFRCEFESISRFAAGDPTTAK